MLNLKKISKFRDLHSVPRCFLWGIPAVSASALVGLGVFAVNPSIDTLLDAPAAYAEEGITPLADTSASLTVDDGKIKDTIFATNGEFAYASHKITVEANNIKSYSLTLTRNIDLTGPTGGEGNSGVVGAAGKTPDQMDNAWGYAFINDGADPTSATYQTLASSNTLSGPAIDSNHNLSGSKQLVFGAKFGSAAASGTYHAEATLSLVATPRVVTNYVVNVNCNSGTGCTSNLNTSSDAESYVYTISSTTPTRSGYKFLGYNTTNTTTANANYAPGKTVTLTAASPTLNLYAIWQQDIQTIKTITNMQQMTAAICAASATGDTNTLTDTRDSSTYTVAKLSDGNCWMTQNLRIIDKTISSADSDMTSGSFTIPASSTSGFSSDTASNAYYSGDTAYGSYYTWCAATAGTCSSATSSGVDATSSICPKGWKLPKNGEYGTLNTKYSGAWVTEGSYGNKNGRWFGAASTSAGGAFFPAAGFYNDSSPYRVGSNGYYWSRTAYTSTNAYHLYFSSSDVVPASSSNRRLGFSVRCVAYSS